MSALALGIPVGYLVALTTYVVIEAEKYAHRHSGAEYGGRRDDTPQGTDGHTTSPSNGEDGGTKTPDPVITGGGHDYAGLAKPVIGMITSKTRLGIGHVVRSTGGGLTADHQQIRNAVEYAVKKVARTKRRRPMHNTRSWGKIRKRLQFDPLGVVDEFRMDYQRARRAVGQIADVVNMVQQGHFHLQ